MRTANDVKIKLFLRRQTAYSDLTEDIGSGYTEQNFVIQAQQLGLWFQHWFHVEDFLVENDIVGSIVSACALIQPFRLLLILAPTFEVKACELPQQACN